jgi:hypothetical protein
MSSVLERIGNFFVSFHQRYEEYRRPRIPLNLLKSKEPDTVKREVTLPEVNTPKPVVNIDENIIGEFFRP